MSTIFINPESIKNESINSDKLNSTIIGDIEEALTGVKELDIKFNNVPIVKGDGENSIKSNNEHAQADGDFSVAIGGSDKDMCISHIRLSGEPGATTYTYDAESLNDEHYRIIEKAIEQQTPIYTRNVDSDGNYSHVTLVSHNSDGMELIFSGTLDNDNAVSNVPFLFYYIGDANNCSIHANGIASHIEGINGIADGFSSHVEGWGNHAKGGYTHVEGFSNVAQGLASHVEGQYNTTTPFAPYSHAEGVYCTVNATRGHAEGYLTVANGEQSHVEGYKSVAQGATSHAEGRETQAHGLNSHTEGWSTQAHGHSSHAEGRATKANGAYSHAEGYKTMSNGDYSHAEGGAKNNESNIAEGNYSHVEGCDTHAIGLSAHSEGTLTKAGGDNSHAEGYKTIIKEGAANAHAEGRETQANSANSHAEGWSTIANGRASHAEGRGTITNNEYEHASGKYNKSTSGSTLFSVGIGTSDTDRKNAFEITNDGNVYIGGVDEDNKVVIKSELVSLSERVDSVESSIAENARGIADLEGRVDNLENNGSTSTFNYISENTSLKRVEISTPVYATSFYETSDERLKEFEDGIEVDFVKLSKLRKSYFIFNDSKDERHIGVSAQEIREIYPEIVSERSDGFLTVDYAKLSVIALKAVDKLDERLRRLETLLLK